MHDPSDNMDCEHLRTNSERYLIKFLLTSQSSILHQSEGKKSVRPLGNRNCHRWKVLELKDNKHSRVWITEHFLLVSSFFPPWVYISSSDTATPALLWPSHGQKVLAVSVAFPWQHASRKALPPSSVVHLLNFSSPSEHHAVTL